MKRIPALTLAVLAVPLALPAAAGAVGPCFSNGSGHCYAIATLSEQHRASVAALRLQASGLEQQQFTTAENWVLFAGGEQFGAWIETGLMAWPGGEKDTALHPFFAEEKEGQFYVHISPQPASTLTPPDYYVTIDDRYANGCFEIWTLLSHDTGGSYWKTELARYCGWPVSYSYAEVGGEFSPSSTAAVRGAATVAFAEEGFGSSNYIANWQAWPSWNTSYFVDGGLSQTVTGPGNAEWATPGALPSSSATTATAIASPTSTTMKVVTGTNLSPQVAPHPPSYPKPRGTYRATIKDSAGQIEDIYVGSSYPSEATVRSGGQ